MAIDEKADELFVRSGEMISSAFFAFLEGVSNVADYVSVGADDFFVDSPKTALRLTKKGASVVIGFAAGLAVGAVVFTAKQTVDAVQWSAGKSVGLVIGAVVGFAKGIARGSRGTGTNPFAEGTIIGDAAAFLEENPIPEARRGQNPLFKAFDSGVSTPSEGTNPLITAFDSGVSAPSGQNLMLKVWAAEQNEVNG